MSDNAPCTANTPPTDTETPQTQTYQRPRDVFMFHKDKLHEAIYVAIDARHLPEEKHRGRRIWRMFHPYGPYRLDMGRVPDIWYMIFFHLKDARSSFEALRYAKLEGERFDMYLVGPGGKVLGFAGDDVPEPEKK